MYALIIDVIKKDIFEKLDVIEHRPLNMLIHNPNKLSDEECKYAMNSANVINAVFL